MKLFRIPRSPKVYLDVVKLLAIVMVVFNHTGNSGYKMYLDVSAEPAHTLMLAFSALIKIAVPLFFMASGALLLGRDEPYGTVLVRRVLRFALVLLAASLFFYWDGLGAREAFSLPDFLDGLYRNTLTGHLWYLYSYLCMLLLLPFLRRLARGMTAREAVLLAVVYQAAQLLTVADYALYQGTAAHTGYLSFFVAADYVVYPLLGYHIDNLKDDEREETGYILLFLSILAIAGTCVLMKWRMGVDGGWTNANREACMGRLSLIPAVTVFCGLKRLFDRHPVTGKAAGALFVLGSCTFGVYLLDPKWRQFTQGVRTALTPSIGLYGATLVHVLCAVLLGLAATLAWKCLAGLGHAGLQAALMRVKSRESAGE
ncbi:MAG: acyltransferase [Clostridia bacterium]|nr:acyltransferase [Clostridia bacterium]